MNLHVSQTGRGPDVVLLHGFCETHHVWDAFAPLLADEYTVHALDLPGFGHSDPLPSGFTLAAVADKLAHRLREVSIRPRAIIGHSLGGYVALEWLARHAHQADAFFLFHSTYFADPPERQEGRTKSIDFVARHGVGPFVRNLIPGLFHQPDHPAVPHILKMAEATSAKTVMEYTRAMRDRPSHESTVAEFSVKTYLIHGHHDAVISPAVANKMELALPPGHALRLAEAGHMGMIESPQKAAAFIKTLLAR